MKQETQSHLSRKLERKVQLQNDLISGCLPDMTAMCSMR